MVKDLMEMIVLHRFICLIVSPILVGLMLTEIHEASLTTAFLLLNKKFFTCSLAKTAHVSLISILLCINDLHILICYQIAGGSEG